MELIKAAIKTAVASFFSTLQHKLISRRTCSTITQARQEIPDKKYQCGYAPSSKEADYQYQKRQWRYL